MKIICIVLNCIYCIEYKKFLFTWTMLPIIIGNIERGNLKILKRLSETKAFVLSKRLFSSISTYVAKDTNETYKVKVIHK